MNRERWHEFLANLVLALFIVGFILAIVFGKQP